MSESDLELLKRYDAFHAEDAFAEVVRRHVDLVYSAALRQVRTPQLAEEVVQTTFLNLARHTHRLLPGTVVAAWLYQVARRESVDVIRREVRRQLREQIASEMNALNAVETEWKQVEPWLDEAMDALDETDRAAVLLRYFENKSLREVGEALGASENAAQKRLTRAIERLRQILDRRGVTVSAGSLTMVVAAKAVQAAPASLAGAVVATLPLAGSSVAIPATAAAAAANTLAMTTLQKALVTTAFVATLGVGVYNARQTRTESTSAETPKSPRVFSEGTGSSQTASPTAPPGEADARMQDAGRRPIAPRTEARLEQRLNAIVQAAPGLPQAPSESAELARETWQDVGFASPRDTLRTRGWAMLNGSRERFRDSVHLTDGARKGIENMIVQMAERSNLPNKADLVKQVLDSGYGAEEAILLPLMAEDKKVKHMTYRILSETPIAADETSMEVETQMGAGSSKQETVKFRRIGSDWRILIDEEVLKAAQ